MAFDLTAISSTPSITILARLRISKPSELVRRASTDLSGAAADDHESAMKFAVVKDDRPTSTVPAPKMETLGPFQTARGIQLLSFDEIFGIDDQYRGKRR